MLDNLRSIFKQMGVANGTLYLVSRVLERATGGRVRLVRYCLVAQRVGVASAKPMRPDANTQLRAVPEGDPWVARFPRPPHILAARYAAGATCTMALVKGEFAGFIWLQRGRYEEDELRSSYVLMDPARSVWDYDVYVEPRYRIGRTMGRLWQHVDAELAAQGVRWSFSRISAFNPASLSSHAKLGTVPCGSVVYLMVGPWQFSFMGQWPWVHASFGPRSAPTVKLRPPPAVKEGVKE